MEEVSAQIARLAETQERLVQELYSRLAAPVLPVVAGEAVTAEAAQCARSEGLWQLVRGRIVPPDAVPPVRTPPL